jgi:DNA-binding GntR family transcriptional regulator
MDPSEPPSKDDGQSATLASRVFERLREDILEGRLAPGEKLRIEALQERYGVGASPLREALNRLISVRLVEQVERRGFRVAPLSEDDLLELSRARKLINEVIVRESVTHGGDGWEEQLVFAFHRLWRCPMTLPSGQANPEWELLHRKFHEALIAACPTRWLRDFHELLFDCADRYRRLNVRRLDPTHTLDEHRLIMEAAISRDAPRTVQLLNEAIDTLLPPTRAAAAASGAKAARRPNTAGGDRPARPAPKRRDPGALTPAP